MQIKTYFEKSLCESAGLFSLQKKQADLFLLSQTGLITYRQLALCNLHGKTETAGRLSLKTLEKDGLIQSRKLPNQHQNKYYFLTPKGRSILKSLFPPILLEYLQISPKNAYRQAHSRYTTESGQTIFILFISVPQKAIQYHGF